MVTKRTCKTRHRNQFIASPCCSVPCHFINRKYPAAAGSTVIASLYLFGLADMGMIVTLFSCGHADMCMSASTQQTKSRRACGTWAAWWQMCTAPCCMVASSCTQQIRRPNLASCAFFMRYVTPLNHHKPLTNH